MLDTASQDTAAAEAAAADTAPAAAPVETGQPLTVDDIDRWDRGMAAELEAVHAAGARLKQAKTGDDTVTAMGGLQDMSTLEAGARLPAWTTSSPHTRFTACVGVQYPYNVRQPATEPCIDVTM